MLLLFFNQLLELELRSSIIGISNVFGSLSGIIESIDFYGNLANIITIYFQGICDINNLTVRYDNDFRAMPTSGLWCKCNIDFGSAKRDEIGVNSFRNVGNFNVKVKTVIGLGIGDLLEKVDIIATAFKTIDIDGIIFRVPRIVKVGRIEDNYQINVICPFFIDN